MGPIPSVCDPEGVYPYESFAETSRRPGLKRYRFVDLENEFLRVTICPDLGGKVDAILDKRSGKQVLFVPRSICPVRILPRFGFIPGGIEVSFPISHTPIQIETVHCQTADAGGRVYVRCGERELRFGLQWTVEFSLGAGEPFLTQRTRFRNPGLRPHPWMSWSNAALPARPDTEFHFPAGPVLSHGAAVQTIDWAAARVRRAADLDRMTGFFWLDPDVCAFGAYTPSLGAGLYHIADPRQMPGIKLWSYGIGRHEAWGRAASLDGGGYVEIQAGPIRDQSIKESLAPGQEREHLEFWFPSAEPLNIRQLMRPSPRLAAAETVPWFDWPPRPAVALWTAVAAAYTCRQPAGLPVPPEADQNHWAPAGMDELGDALGWAAANSEPTASDAWRFQLGAWLAGRGDTDAALATLAQSDEDRAHALAGRLQLRARRDPVAARQALARIRSEALALHPQVMIERDLALAALGAAARTERVDWLDRAAGTQDEWLLERKAMCLADQDRFEEALALLERLPFQMVHQRYARSELWLRCRAALGLPAEPVPATLGEDDLARFGAYREFDA